MNKQLQVSVKLKYIYYLNNTVKTMKQKSIHFNVLSPPTFEKVYQKLVRLKPSFQRVWTLASVRRYS